MGLRKIDERYNELSTDPKTGQQVLKSMIELHAASVETCGKYCDAEFGDWESLVDLYLSPLAMHIGASAIAKMLLHHAECEHGMRRIDCAICSRVIPTSDVGRWLSKPENGETEK